MSFSDLLSGFIGETVEIFLINQMYTGVLLAADNCFITLETNNTYYYSPPTQVTIIVDGVQLIRVIA
jgi:hypothetical protein